MYNVDPQSKCFGAVTVTSQELPRLPEKEIIARINTQEPFSAQVDSGAFSLSIKRYSPFIGSAIHNGGQVVEGFADPLRVSQDERHYEEDPFTAQLVDALPIVLVGQDSRYMYDLNRDPQHCIYTEAWGKQVWQRPLKKSEKEALLKRHQSYYRVLGALLNVLGERFSATLLYDMHSYNYKRIEGHPPLFNIGTHFIDARFTPVINHLQQTLSTIAETFDGERAVCDEVFYGKGYQAAFCSAHHPDCLCIPLEVKKLFMDENAATLNPEVFAALQGQMADALHQNSQVFQERFIVPTR